MLVTIVHVHVLVRIKCERDVPDADTDAKAKLWYLKIVLLQLISFDIGK